jgi:hypothetical protein
MFKSARKDYEREYQVQLGFRLEAPFKRDNERRRHFGEDESLM